MLQQKKWHASYSWKDPGRLHRKNIIWIHLWWMGRIRKWRGRHRGGIGPKRHRVLNASLMVNLYSAINRKLPDFELRSNLIRTIGVLWEGCEGDIRLRENYGGKTSGEVTSMIGLFVCLSPLETRHAHIQARHHVFHNLTFSKPHMFNKCCWRHGFL